MAHRHHRARTLAEDERPREKLRNLGPEALADDELLAVILARGTRGKGLLRIARRVLDSHGLGTLLGEGAVERLCQLCDVGEVHACQILACFELGRRFFQKANGISLRTPEAVYEHLRSMCRLSKEAFRGLYLDVKGRLVHDEIVSLGILTMNLVHPREVFRPAIEHSAASVILVHNHPSGDPTPSEDDVKLTKQLVEAGEILGIEVLDHIIICDRDYLSMKAKNLF